MSMLRLLDEDMENLIASLEYQYEQGNYATRQVIFALYEQSLQMALMHVKENIGQLGG